VNRPSLPKTVTRQRSGCDLNPGPSAPESSTLTTRLPSHPSTDEVANSGKKHKVIGNRFTQARQTVELVQAYRSPHQPNKSAWHKK